MKKSLLPMLLFCAAAQLLQAQCQGVERQLLGIGVLLIADGYELTHDIRCESLRSNENDDYNFTLYRNWSYKIYSVCDGDCSDIDLKIYDENGNLLDSDTLTDDKPVVEVTPRWTGRFRLNVRMYNCRVNPCRFGIAIFGK